MKNIKQARRDKLMNSIDNVLDEYNAGKISKAQMTTCLAPTSQVLAELDEQLRESRRVGTR